MGNYSGSALHRSSDDDDKRLFEARSDRLLLSNTILRIKHNDSLARHVIMAFVDDWEDRAWKRLGQILGQNSIVEELRIISCPAVNMAGMCIGLQSNRSIQTLNLSRIDLGDERLSSLVPFLSHNPGLKELRLVRCNIGSSAINLLSCALLQRSKDNLGTFNLSDNHISDMDLKKLVPVFERRTNKMRELNLENNQIGSRGCGLIAKLLGSQGCNLASLYLGDNDIDDKATDVLAKSLAKNTRLRELDLRNNDGITPEGWLAMLKLVCDTSSIKGILESNHYLHSLGMAGPQGIETLHRDLDMDDANLLSASLKLNRSYGNTMNNSYDKAMIIRRKILWSHAWGHLNIGDSSIATGAMPRILAWIGDCSNASNANLIQYHMPRLPNKTMDVVRLDAIYRIVQSRPDLCSINKAGAPYKKRNMFWTDSLCSELISAISQKRLSYK